MCLGGPYFAYLGYDNLSHEYGWRHIGGGFYMGGVWVNYMVLVWAVLVTVWLFWLLWDDYLTLANDPTSSPPAS